MYLRPSWAGMLMNTSIELEPEVSSTRTLARNWSSGYTSATMASSFLSMVAAMRLFLYDMTMSFTETMNTPAARSRSWVSPFSKRAHTKRTRVMAMTTREPGSKGARTFIGCRAYHGDEG